MRTIIVLILLCFLADPFFVKADNHNTKIPKLWQRKRIEQTLAVYQNKALMFSKDDKSRKAELVSLETGKNIWINIENDLSMLLQQIEKNMFSYDFTYHDHYLFLRQFERNNTIKLSCFDYLTGEKRWDVSDKYYWKLPQSFHNDQAFLITTPVDVDAAKPVIIGINYITGMISYIQTIDLNESVNFTFSVIGAYEDHLLLSNPKERTLTWFDYINNKIVTNIKLENIGLMKTDVCGKTLITRTLNGDIKCLQRMTQYWIHGYDLDSGKKLWQLSVYESNYHVKDNKIYFYTKQELCNDDSANLLNIFDMKTKTVTKKIKTSNGKPIMLVIDERNNKLIIRDKCYTKNSTNSYIHVVIDDKIDSTLETDSSPCMFFGDYILSCDSTYSLTDNTFFGHISCYKPPWFEENTTHQKSLVIVNLILKLIRRLFMHR